MTPLCSYNKLIKVVVNHTSGRIAGAELKDVLKLIETITGQVPIRTFAKKSVSSFKIRQGMVTGCKVTLRKKRMEAFINKLVNYILMREKGFSGFRRSAINTNTFNMGLSNIALFPELEKDILSSIGINITFVSNTIKKDDMIKLLSKYNLPFKASTLHE
jgi:large subunit ribosomal protein L5